MDRDQFSVGGLEGEGGSGECAGLGEGTEVGPLFPRGGGILRESLITVENSSNTTVTEKINTSTLFHQHLLSTCCIPGPVLTQENMLSRKTCLLPSGFKSRFITQLTYHTVSSFKWDNSVIFVSSKS